MLFYLDTDIHALQEEPLCLSQGRYQKIVEAQVDPLTIEIDLLDYVV